MQILFSRKLTVPPSFVSSACITFIPSIQAIDENIEQKQTQGRPL